MKVYKVSDELQVEAVMKWEKSYLTGPAFRPSQTLRGPLLPPHFHAIYGEYEAQVGIDPN